MMGFEHVSYGPTRALYPSYETDFIETVVPSRLRQQPHLAETPHAPVALMVDTVVVCQHLDAGGDNLHFERPGSLFAVVLGANEHRRHLLPARLHQPPAAISSRRYPCTARAARSFAPCPWCCAAARSRRTRA